jgi:hypothetical protein
MTHCKNTINLIPSTTFCTFILITTFYGGCKSNYGKVIQSSRFHSCSFHLAPFILFFFPSNLVIILILQVHGVCITCLYYIVCSNMLILVSLLHTTLVSIFETYSLPAIRYIMYFFCILYIIDT